MKFHESPIFGKVSEPESFDELIALATAPIEDESRNVYIWRGQADISWTIDSSAVRRLRLSKKAILDSSLEGYETRLLRKATHQGLRIHEGRVLSDFELLARLQHHGAATRLLDATRSILVGLYFASEALPDRHGLLVGFHSSYLGGGEGDPEERPYESIVKDLGRYQHPQTWDSPVITPRIAAQHSQFLYSAIGEDGRGSLRIARNAKSLIAIAVSPDFKRAALRILSDQFDIRYSTLFPDIHGFCYLNGTRFGEFEHDRW